MAENGVTAVLRAVCKGALANAIDWIINEFYNRRKFITYEIVGKWRIR